MGDETKTNGSIRIPAGSVKTIVTALGIGMASVVGGGAWHTGSGLHDELTSLRDELREAKTVLDDLKLKLASGDPKMDTRVSALEERMRHDEEGLAEVKAKVAK